MQTSPAFCHAVLEILLFASRNIHKDELTHTRRLSIHTHTFTVLQRAREERDLSNLKKATTKISRGRSTHSKIRRSGKTYMRPLLKSAQKYVEFCIRKRAVCTFKFDRLVTNVMPDRSMFELVITKDLRLKVVGDNLQKPLELNSYL